LKPASGGIFVWGFTASVLSANINKSVLPVLPALSFVEVSIVEWIQPSAGKLPSAMGDIVARQTRMRH